MTKMLSTHKADGGVTVIVLDAADDKVNKLSTELGDELGPLLERLEGDTSCAGVVIISGKDDNFIAGADIDALAKVTEAAEGQQLSRHGQQMLNQLAGMKIPVVAAINGACLGGGLELALACHGRVCSDSGKTKLGLPEIQLGLIPGAGGTQRLPRLVGVQAALDMILTGRNIRPRKAKKMELVDEVAPRAALEQAAVARVLRLANERERAEKRNFLQAELDELRAWADGADLPEMLLEGNALGRMVMFREGRKMVQSKTRGHYPAPFAAIRAVEAGLSKGIDRGLEVEAAEFGELVVSDVSRRLVELFYATQSIKKDTGVADPKVRADEVRRLGVLGGGLMGAGIAYVSAGRGVSVRVKEQDHDAAAACLKTVWDLVAPMVRRKKMKRQKADALLSRVTASPDLTGIARADMVIEAVFEDLELKQRLLREVEQRVSDQCIFASNTSSIPITRIAEAADRPEQVLGMHFFSPVHKMPLLEVIVTDLTSDQATATAVAFGKRLGKQVIVVRDGVGFYTSRILAPYMNEAARVLVEGAAVDDIDRAMVDFGFPVGPIVLMDEVGIDVGEKVAGIMHEAFGDRMKPPEGLAAVAADDRKGRKNRRGFYLYGGGKKKKKKQVDETVYDLLPGGRERRPLDVEEARLRVALQMVNEAMHCMGDGVLRNARDGNIGAIFGLGFPPFLGGPFRYVDVRGAEAVVEDLERLEGKFGPRFSPAPALLEAARDHHKFCD